MKKSNLLALLAGLMVAALSAGCGSAGGSSAVDPIQQAKTQGLIPNGNPKDNADNGPIDGNWSRRDGNTTCLGGTLDPKIESSSFYIDNRSGYVIVRYYTSDKKKVAAIMAIPVTYTYSNSSAYGSLQSGNTGTVQVTSAGAGNCEYVDTNRACNAGEYVTPNVNAIMKYTVVSGNQLDVLLDRDLVCSNGQSDAMLLQLQ